MTLQEYKDNPYAWPGGYALLALMDDGETLCHACITGEEEVHEVGDADGWKFVDAFIHWEGSPLLCAHCNEELLSEYGEVD